MATHHCLSCSEPFESPEFISYILRLRSKTVKCLRCQTDNFIVPQKNIGYFLLLFISIIAGIIMFLLPNIGMAIATYSELNDTFRIGLLPLIFGGFLGLGTARLLMNLFNWLYGSVSQNRKYKAPADFE